MFLMFHPNHLLISALFLCDQLSLSLYQNHGCNGIDSNHIIDSNRIIDIGGGQEEYG